MPGDAQGVVFNARYADFVDIAVNEYIRTLFGDYQHLLDQDLDIQVVSLTVNWKAPAKFDDVLEARIRAGRIGNTSFTLHLEFFRYGDGAFIADADVTYVVIQPSVMGKVTIPDHIRELLEQVQRHRGLCYGVMSGAHALECDRWTVHEICRRG